MTFRKTVTGLGLVAFALAVESQAHIPIFSGADTGTSPENAVFIDDASISHAVYHEVTAQTAHLWVTFDFEAGQEIYTQLGVPVIDWLADFRPAFAVLGPGLPRSTCRSTFPTGWAACCSRPMISTSRVFRGGIHRHGFVDLRRTDRRRARAGTYYLVAFVPSGDVGKGWVGSRSGDAKCSSRRTSRN